jgi:protein-S-isoprenylcysteine O-methyltransferase Ste14
MSLALSTVTTPQKFRWQKIVRRIRVPLGFVVAAIVLLFAAPAPRSFLWSLPLVLFGLWLRGYAAGYVKKNSELTQTGPYAYTRNPLYLGSMSLAAGFAVAAGGISTNRWWLLVLLVTMFLAIYVPTILSEEAFLRATFPDFEDYARHVPRLLPRLTPARSAASNQQAGRFAPERYRHHREYNAAIGAAAIYTALALRMWLRIWLGHRL